MATSSRGLFSRNTSSPSLPQINLDEFNADAMLIALRDYGTYELVGPTINALEILAKQTLSEAQKALSLPIETLSKVDHQGTFNGFQNVKAQTAKQVDEGKASVIRNQIALHYKPYKESRVPTGINADIFKEYYKQARNVLVKHYNQIANTFMHNSTKSDLANDEQSVLMMRRYFASTNDGMVIQKHNQATLKANSTTGIPPHSDHGLVTLVTSDKPGLEVLKGDNWIAADHTPGNLRFFVNFADWALFQILYSATLDQEKFGKYQFREGLHRVPHVIDERHSLILALNPSLAEFIPTPKGPTVTFKDFLQSDKSKFRDTSRDESADNLSKLINNVMPTNPIAAPETMPKLYVKENGLNGQASWILVNGKGEPFCSKDITALPNKAYEEFSYAFLSLEAINATSLPKAKNEYTRIFEVKLKYANDVYVVDESVAYQDDKKAKEMIAKTLIPLQEYMGNYKNPVYLIQRPLMTDEASEISFQHQNSTKPKF